MLKLRSAVSADVTVTPRDYIVGMAVGTPNFHYADLHV